MAIVSGTFQTVTAIGQREDLEDVIYNISPTDTPFLTRAARMKAKAVLHEWQIDTLAGATANAVIEGDETSFTTPGVTTRVRNYLQISKKSVIISGTLDAVDKAGRDSELSYQMAKRSAELKRDMEQILTANQASSAGGSATARTLGGIEAWLTSNVSRAGSGASGGYSTTGIVVAATDAGTVRAFSEGQLKTVLASVWSSGGSPDTIMVGSYQKQNMTTFPGIATQYRENSGVKAAVILASAAVYVSDFGELRIVPNRFSRSRSALVLDMDYWGVAYLRPFKTEALAKTGDAEKRHILVEYTLVSKNEAASGIVADLSSS